MENIFLLTCLLDIINLNLSKESSKNVKPFILNKSCPSERSNLKIVKKSDSVLPIRSKPPNYRNLSIKNFIANNKRRQATIMNLIKSENGKNRIKDVFFKKANDKIIIESIKGVIYYINTSGIDEKIPILSFKITEIVDGIAYTVLCVWKINQNDKDIIKNHVKKFHNIIIKRPKICQKQLKNINESEEYVKEAEYAIIIERKDQIELYDKEKGIKICDFWKMGKKCNIPILMGMVYCEPHVMESINKNDDGRIETRGKKLKNSLVCNEEKFESYYKIDNFVFLDKDGNYIKSREAILDRKLLNMSKDKYYEKVILKNQTDFISPNELSNDFSFTKDNWKSVICKGVFDLTKTTKIKLKGDKKMSLTDVLAMIPKPILGKGLDLKNGDEINL